MSSFVVGFAETRSSHGSLQKISQVFRRTEHELSDGD